MNIHTFSRHAVSITGACIVLTGCASSSDDSAASHHARLSDTLVPPVSPDSPSSPTLGPANADPHGFEP